MTTVAVIGGGAAGIGAARALLKEDFDVLLFESAPRLGGNCLGFEVRGPDGSSHRIDVGVSDFNRQTFHHVSSLIDDLGLETHPICQDVHVATPFGQTVGYAQNGSWHFEGGLDEASLNEEIRAFRARALEVLQDPLFEGWTFERYLDHIGASKAFRERCLYPRAMGCFPMPGGMPENYDVRSLVRFWNLHGIVSDVEANRHCVRGGMHRYVRAFEDWFRSRGGELHCRSRVLGLRRERWHVEVRVADAQDRHRRFKVQHVVLAASPHETLSLLEDPTPQEREVMGDFRGQRARLVVHQDPKLMGGDRERWGAFHYVAPRGGLPKVRPTITFFPNKLGRLPSEVPDVFVTMNPHMEPDRDKVLGERFFMHPLADRGTARRIARAAELRGVNRTWFAGSHLCSPFVHESAMQTGIDAARGILEFERGKVPTVRETRGTLSLRHRMTHGSLVVGQQ